jgi:signal transduction histidine kinase
LNKRENKTNTNYVETKQGELHLIEWHNTYIQNRQGDVIGTFSSGEDITEKHILKLYLADQQTKHRAERLNSIIEAAERERQYLAYELHDGVNQVLTTCKLLLESELDSGASGNVQRTYNYIQEVINTLRELSHELNPAELGNEGLYQSAVELIERVNATGKIKITTDIKGTKHLKNLCRSINLSLFRIMQEALTNIIKHAGAEHAHISLVASPRAVDLEILDNGKGFDRDKKNLGLGLKTIYTRAEAAGGKAHIQSNSGEGTLLSVHIPIARAKV